MRTIGLIGGMSWETTAVYYRVINQAIRERLGGLHSGKIALHSFDFDQVIRLQVEGRWDEAAELLSFAGMGLAATGADCVLICTSAMHRVAGSVAARSVVPLIDMVDETAKAVKAAGVRKPLLLASRHAMEEGFYAERMAKRGIDVRIPDAEDRELVHKVILGELCRGRVEDRSRTGLLALIDKEIRNGVDGVIFGCAELSLLIDPACLPVPGFDSTHIHARAAVEFALEGIETRCVSAA